MNLGGMTANCGRSRFLGMLIENSWGSEGQHSALKKSEKLLRIAFAACDKA